MTFFLLGIALTIAAIGLHNRFLGFTAQTPADYATAGPAFDIRQRLNGPIACEGVIYGPTGRVTSRFVADFQADWQGNVGTMSEVFRYDSGTVQHRKWTLTLGNDGAIKAEADDVIGAGTGKQAGNAVLLNYRIKLSEIGRAHV